MKYIQMNSLMSLQWLTIESKSHIFILSLKQISNKKWLLAPIPNLSLPYHPFFFPKPKPFYHPQCGTNTLGATNLWC